MSSGPLTRAHVLRTLDRLKHDVTRFSPRACDRKARLAYLDHVRYGVSSGTLADNTSVAPAHRTYRGIAAWAARSASGLQLQAYNRVITAANKMV
jgi:hypothetical protein